MATVKEILKQQKEKEKQEAKRAKEIARQEAAYEAKKLREAAKVIEEALNGFNYEKRGSIFGNLFQVKLRNRDVFVVYKFENRKVRYSDESPLEDVRYLVIDIGYMINRPSLTTSVESFAKSFANFLNSERLV